MANLSQQLANLFPGPTNGKSDVVHWDEALRGFGLRVWASGKRKWIVRYRMGTRQRVVTLGAVEELSAAKARRKAADILAARRLGEDERAKIEQRKSEVARPTERNFADLVRTYRQHALARQKPRTRLETVRHLDGHWQSLHDQPLSRISRTVVAARLLELSDVSGPVAANRARAALSAMFTWAMGAGLVEHNPVIGTNKNRERSRDRVLTAAELCRIWQATERPSDFNAIVRLLVLTGQRREEVGGLAWSELDLEGRLWRLPSRRTKNNRAHDVPLSRQAAALIAGLPAREGRDLVFGEGAGPFSGWSRAKQRLDKCAMLAGWTLHDIRRTVVTCMAEGGIQPYIVEAVVNHVSGHRAGIAGVYNRAAYSAEKRSALEVWADRVMAIVQASHPACGH